MKRPPDQQPPTDGAFSVTDRTGQSHDADFHPPRYLVVTTDELLPPVTVTLPDGRTTRPARIAGPESHDVFTEGRAAWGIRLRKADESGEEADRARGWICTVWPSICG